MVNPAWPRRGEVWEYVQGSRQYRVLIVSNDEYNEPAVERGLREFLTLP